MQLARYNPSRDLRRLEQQIDNFWRTNWGIFPTMLDTAPMDMYEEDGKLVAEVALPNFKKDEIKVTADEGILEIRAEHKAQDEEKGNRRYYVRETNSQYMRRIGLPAGVDAGKIEANFNDGVLKLTMPTSEQKKNARQVDIK